MNNYNINLLMMALAMSITALPVSAAHNHHATPAAPIGIMGHHIHPQGEWMLSYSYMNMQMDGNRDATNRLSAPLSGYMVSPLSMDMDMNMLGVMYGFSETITFMVMLPVMSISMDHMVNMNGNEFTTEASGIGDLKFSTLFESGANWVTNIGLNIPTGSIDEKDVTPASSGIEVQLPYPMQLGSGSYEFTLGSTFIKNYANSSWGNKADIIVRLDDNDRDYKLGKRIELNSWYSLGVSDKSTLSVRLKLLGWEDISGADSVLNPMMVPTADVNLRGGTRADFLLGYNLQLTQTALVGFEVGAPVYQNLHGPQLETDLIMQLGVQYEF